MDDLDPTADGTSPDELLAELQKRIGALEAEGVVVPSFVKLQLERVKRMMAAGELEGVQFMQSEDEGSGIMGFSIPLESGSSEDNPEEGAT